MKKIAILQSNYVPWKGYFDLIRSVDEFVIYDEVQFTKNDWRNRNKLKGPSGLHWLTIPVKQLRLTQKINETIVASNKWNRKHWNTIISFYSRSPYFNEVKDFLSDLYLNIPSDNLSEINVYFIKAINQFLGIKTNIINSIILDLRGDKNERLVDACLKLGADVYLSGPSAQSYLDVKLFAAHGIKIEWMSYDGYPEYKQLHGPFVHTVSILDTILCNGLSAHNFLMKL